MSKEVLLCKDCKYSRVGLADKIFTLGGLIGVKDFQYKCAKFVKVGRQVINPVTGPEKVKKELSFCELVRKYVDECGPSAKYWVPKHKRDLFKMLTKDDND